MYKLGCLFILMLLLISCQSSRIFVQNHTELKNAIINAEPGDEIVMANGVWQDVRINFSGKGTKGNPIILRAEKPGKVTIEGQSEINIGGEYLTVNGLYFKNGYTPGKSVIRFKIDNENIANHCKVVNCVIENYSQPNRYNPDHWVEFWGRHNQLKNCYLAGKSNQGPTIRVYLTGNENIRNYHQITNNHFGPRPRKGGPRAETMQIGASNTSMTPSHIKVANNFFEKCNGEVEVISSKSNFNEFRNNIFYQCEGSLVMRHGNYCVIDGNIFIGDEKSQFNGGIRVINTGHWITNNYFYMLKGDEFRAPLAIMNGIPKSPLNRYNQVTDAVIAHNTWIDCQSPWQISVGANMNKKDVLPPSEIRSARPRRILIANNVIYNHLTDETPVKKYDKIDGITFKNNLFDTKSSSLMQSDGISAKELKMDKRSDWLYVPSNLNHNDFNTIYSGHGFEDIQKDVFGNSRTDRNTVGAMSKPVSENNVNIDISKYGPNWFTPEKSETQSTIIPVSTEGEFLTIIAAANHGDIVEFAGGIYNIDKSIVVNKKITLRSKDENSKAQIVYSGVENTPAFQMNPNGNLILDNVTISGKGKQYAFAPLKENMSSVYNLYVNNSQIENFKNILIAYRGSFADTISFSNTKMKDCLNGLELAAETDDKGDYNAEFVNISNCNFETIQSNVINFYRGGYDESTIGGNLLVEGSLFKNCGKREKSKILIKTRGIINVDITNNTFNNNPVKLVALLWGEKNNLHSGNKVNQSGKIRVDQYLKQKLMY